MDANTWKNIKVMFGLDFGFIITMVIQNLTNADLLKQIAGITTYVLLLLAVLNSINVVLSIFEKFKKKKDGA